jgi:hypothetical protein
MKKLLTILLFISGSVCAQSLNSKEISSYVKLVDSLRHHKVLKVVKLSNMSACAGALTGYYHEGKLVYLKGLYAAELGYTEQKLYLKDSIPYKLHYRQYFAEWEKYALKYPDREAELDEKKMTYSDTLYHITFTNPVKIAKTSRGKYVNNKMEKDMLGYIKGCVKEMYEELEKERTSH